MVPECTKTTANGFRFSKVACVFSCVSENFFALIKCPVIDSKHTEARTRQNSIFDSTFFFAPGSGRRRPSTMTTTKYATLGTPSHHGSSKNHLVENGIHSPNSDNNSDCYHGHDSGTLLVGKGGMNNSSIINSGKNNNNNLNKSGNNLTDSTSGKPGSPGGTLGNLGNPFKDSPNPDQTSSPTLLVPPPVSISLKQQEQQQQQQSKQAGKASDEKDSKDRLEVPSAKSKGPTSAKKNSSLSPKAPKTPKFGSKSSTLTKK